MFLMIDESDHFTGLTGLTPTVTLSKAGGTFAAPSGSVSEVGNGWYKVAGNATDTNTLGPLVLHASASGADPVDAIFEVVAFDPQAIALGALMPTTAGRTLDVSATGEAGIDWNNIGSASASVVLSNTTIGTLTTYTGNTPQTGDGFARLGAPTGASLAADLAAARTDVTSIKTKTDSLTFTVAGTVNANATHLSGNSAAADTLELFALALDAATGQLDAGSFASGALDGKGDWPTMAQIQSEFAIDGLSFSVGMTALFAVIVGQTQVTGDTVEFLAVDGATTKVAITYNGAGVRETVVIS